MKKKEKQQADTSGNRKNMPITRGKHNHNKKKETKGDKTREKIDEKEEKCRKNY